MAELNKEYSTFGTQIGCFIGANVVGFLLGFISLPILTKGIGAQLYGTYSLVQTTISLISPIAALGFSTALVRFLAGEKDKSKIRDSFFSPYCVMIVSGIVFSLLLFLSSEQLAKLIFGDINLAIYIKLASAVVLLNPIGGLSLAFFRAFRRIELYTVLSLAKSACQVGLIILAILLGFQLIGVIIAIILTAIIFDLVTLFIVVKQIGIQRPRFANMKSYLKFGVPLTPNLAIAWIMSSSDRYMISYFMGVTATGIYSAAYGLAIYASFILAPLQTVLFPTVTKSYTENNLEETRNYLKYSFKYFMMVAIPSAFGLSILAKPILQILTTPEFISGNIIIPFVALGAILYSIFQISVNIIYLINRTKLIVRLLSASAALNIALNLVLIPRIGIMGAAVATLIAYGVLGISTLITTRRYLKFDLSTPFVLKSLFSSAVMAFSIWLIKPEAITLTIISIVGGALIYFAVLILIKGLSKGELSFFVNFIKDNIKRITGIT